MITKKAERLKKRIKLAKPLLEAMDIEQSRLWQDRLGALGATALSAKLRFEPLNFPYFKCMTLTPKKDADPERIMLYLHGGSYTAGSLAYSCGFGSVLACETKLTVVCVAYRLAPEFPFPAAIEDALCVYEYLLKTHTPENIILAGESAGGGLTLALLLKIKQLGLPQPSCAVCMSPWADLTCSSDAFSRNSALDPSLVEKELKYSASLYAGQNSLTDPLISPLYGDLSGLPPIMLLAGTDELLADDTMNMSQKLANAGVTCLARTYEGLWHVFVLFPIPEAKQAILSIIDFTDRHSGSKKQD